MYMWYALRNPCGGAHCVLGMCAALAAGISPVGMFGQGAPRTEAALCWVCKQNISFPLPHLPLTAELRACPPLLPRVAELCCKRYQTLEYEVEKRVHGWEKKAGIKLQVAIPEATAQAKTSVAGYPQSLHQHCLGHELFLARCQTAHPQRNVTRTWLMFLETIRWMDEILHQLRPMGFMNATTPPPQI